MVLPLKFAGMDKWFLPLFTGYVTTYPYQDLSPTMLVKGDTRHQEITKEYGFDDF